MCTYVYVKSTPMMNLIIHALMIVTVTVAWKSQWQHCIKKAKTNSKIRKKTAKTAKTN